MRDGRRRRSEGGAGATSAQGTAELLEKGGARVEEPRPEDEIHEPRLGPDYRRLLLEGDQTRCLRADFRISLGSGQA